MDITKMTGCFEDEHYKVYYLNGVLHREDGPAVDTIAQQGWFINGKRHREDGPAFIKQDGQRHWFLNDEEVTWQEVYHNAKTAEQKVSILIHASADPSNLDDILSLTTC